MPGPYRVAITPYLKEIIDVCNDRKVDRVVCQKSSQVAWTDGVVNNTVGYHIDVDPAPIMILFPTGDLGKRYSKEKLAPMIRDTPCLSEKIADPKSRDSGNTLQSKNFPGGHLELVGSNSPGPMSSSPIRIIIVEEPDRCAANAGGEGNSLDIVYERGNAFHNRKILVGGSPTLRGESNIEDEMALSDQRRYHVPCPHCKTLQTLEWHMVVWAKDEKQNHPAFGRHLPQTALLKCKHEKCGKTFDNGRKIQALGKGKWIAEQPFTGVAGFYLNALYSPFEKASLPELVKKFLAANRKAKQGDPTKMITFTNTTLGEAYEEDGEKIPSTSVMQRREVYGAQVPEGVFALTAGVDVQDDRIEFLVEGWGKDRESWAVDYVILYGDTSQPPVWDDLDSALLTTYQHESGALMNIHAVGVDSGHQTMLVYEWCRERRVRRIYPVKGVGDLGRPLVSPPRKVKIANTNRSVKLFTVGSDEAKRRIYATINVKRPGPGYRHFPLGHPMIDVEFFDQLLCEKLVPRFDRGERIKVFKKMRHRNEVSSCTQYSLAAYEIARGTIQPLLRGISRGGRPNNYEAANRPARERGGNGRMSRFSRKGI